MPVRAERFGHVQVVTLDRPDKRNAFNAEMTQQLDAALNDLEDDATLRLGVITSSASVFSAGTDLSTGSGGPTARGGSYGIVRRARSKPLIAAVEGPALGGGFEIVLACDLVVASESATFGLPEVSRGLIANCGALFRGPRALPLNVANELLLTGDAIGAARAATLGLVNRLTSTGEALAESLRMADRISRNSPVAVAATLRATNLAAAALDSVGWLTTDDATRTVLASPDAREGKNAFLERREPRWS